MNNFTSDNGIILVSACSWLIAQLIKILIEFARVKKFNVSLLFSSGGMPSSHTSLVIAMTTYIGYLEGFNSTYFAISAVLSSVVMYDATGVRRAAGKQAEVLNMLIENLNNHEIKLEKKLKELLGHTPIQVCAGFILGIVVATIFKIVYSL